MSLFTRCSARKVSVFATLLSFFILRTSALVKLNRHLSNRDVSTPSRNLLVERQNQALVQGRGLQEAPTKHQNQNRQNAGSQDPCAYVYNQQNGPSTDPLSAHDIYACLITVPFHKDTATRLIQYVKDTFEFQSTLAYLRSPPASYQQPSIDVFQTLDFIQDQVDTGTFTNEYSFESALQRLVLRMHDGHVIVLAGMLTFASFGSPLTLTSISGDGVEIPKVYITDDIYAAQDPTANFTASAVTKINGQVAEDYLERYAKLNSIGNVDPHADWNDLFDSQAANAQFSSSFFDVVSSFYTEDNISFTFENGSSTPVMEFQGTLDLSSCTGGIANGGDVYNCLIAPRPPTSSSTSIAPTATSAVVSSSTVQASDSLITPTATAASTSSDYLSGSWTYAGGFIYGDIISVGTSNVPTATSNLVSTTTSSAPGQTSSDAAPATPSDWNLGYGLTAYPSSPAVAQPNLGVTGFTTGYILDLGNGQKVGVLSIPTFNMDGVDVARFSNTTAQFIQQVQAAGVSKVVIDLQQNLGGLSILAWDTFRQFFPAIDPFGGSRRRSSPYADALGQTLTPLGQSIPPSNVTWYQAFLDDPWAASSYIDTQTNARFQNFSELFGPHPDNGDEFSTVQRDDLDDPMFDAISTSDYDDITAGIVPYGYVNRRPTVTTPPFASDDILLLVDGLCSSACAQFTEFMHHEAGVRTVALGGLPQPGPMQGVAGNRGARAWDNYDLDGDMLVAASINATLYSIFPVRDPGVLQPEVYFNLEDQIRRNEYFPLQFAYEAADCRIFNTFTNFNNYTRMWIDAADALWSIDNGNNAKCVPDSAGHTTPYTDTVGPSSAQKLTWRQAGRLSVASDVSGSGFQVKAGADVGDPDAIDDKVQPLNQVLVVPQVAGGFAGAKGTGQPPPNTIAAPTRPIKPP